MKCPVPCCVCGDIIELGAAHFHTIVCTCSIDGSCTHGICDDCFEDRPDDSEDEDDEMEEF